MPCKLCTERGKTWEGGDPECAFVGRFEDNWNCATINALRDIISDDGWEIKKTPGVNHEWCDDQNWATIAIDDVLEPSSERWVGYTLWMTWYKRRGRTEKVYILGDDEPRKPTEAECLAVIKHYREKEKKAAA